MRRLLLGGFLLLLASSTSLAAQSGSTEAGQNAPSEITLAPGDVVRVVIYREPDLNGDFPVGPDGLAVLPLIGEQRVAGVPLRRLREQLIVAYRAHIVNPSINIIPLRRLNVLGGVQKPGQYLVDPTTSLAGVLAMAGGATADGDIRRVQIIRGDQVIRQRARAAESISAAGIRSDDQIHVERRNWFDRNTTFLVSSMLSVTGIVTSIILAGQ